MSASMAYTRVVVSSTVIPLILIPAQTLAQPPAIDRIVAFGASLTDTGNAFIG